MLHLIRVALWAVGGEGVYAASATADDNSRKPFVTVARLGSNCCCTPHPPAVPLWTVTEPKGFNGCRELRRRADEVAGVARHVNSSACVCMQRQGVGHLPKVVGESVRAAREMFTCVCSLIRLHLCVTTLEWTRTTNNPPPHSTPC